MTAERIAALLEPYAPGVLPGVADQLLVYLDLIVKWNARTNLTAIRNPEEIVRRHFGESLFLSRHLPAAQTLLDLGSGAGFPGVPIQLERPDLKVTLAESQMKKAAFLRELARELQLGMEIWAGRAEDMAASRRFDVVTLRAVDDPTLAIKLARMRLAQGGTIAHLTIGTTTEEALAVPGAERRILQFLR